MEETRFKDLSELTLMDDYMFGAVMQDTRLIKPLIECILDMKLTKAEFVEPQKVMKEGYSARGIRLDLYVEDTDGVIYNVEVQTTRKKALAKRMRYYQSIIDLHILNPGADYEKLKKSYVIFICNFDAFGRDRCVYRFENRCIEELSMPFGDGTEKVVVNTKGRSGDVSEELKALLRYLDDGTVSGDYTRELEKAVDDIKQNEDRRREYMVWLAHEMEVKEEGRREGILEGRKEGMLEGRKEGMLEGRLSVLANLAADGLLPIEVAAAKANMSVEDFEKVLEDNMK